MTHANAHLTPRGRLRLARSIVEEGWSYRRAGERFQCSPATAKKWADRLRAGLPMTDRSSRPHRSPNQTRRRTERRILALRFTRRWGPHRIAYHLHLARATVERVLRRYRAPLLAHVDQSTGLPVRKPTPVRYERAKPGELVHMDIKKLGRIPDGGGHKRLGRREGKKNNDGHGRGGRGYAFLHHAIDDHSRLAYSEIHTDERKETVIAFWRNAVAFFAEAGITVERLMTDNGPAYRSRELAAELGAIKHTFTRPYRPQTNGKVERFNRTLAAEWAYAKTYDSDETRAADYQRWVHHYNHHRPHTGIDGQTPSDRVHNLTRNY
ncbi:IS481 family transposase, partial [Gryllotalpicola koreensis]|uniref:IS481 family transposase n=1 Tax=Gryllotalpicola koreensis TaxID=993086 RepID=UPI0031CDD996